MLLFVLLLILLLVLGGAGLVVKGLIWLFWIALVLLAVHVIVSLARGTFDSRY